MDKYGVLYEGRAGGLDQAVIGAQAQGFNAQTTGIASIGDHTLGGRDATALDALARYIRWKLHVHGQPLSRTVTLVSAGGSASRYPAGARVPAPARARPPRHPRPPARASPLRPARRPARALVHRRAPRAQLRHPPERRAGRLLRGLRRDRAGHRGAGPDGSPLAGEQVEVQVNGDGRWRTARRPSSAPTAPSPTVSSREAHYLRPRYPGRTDLRGHLFAALLLRLRPRARSHAARRPAPSPGAACRSRARSGRASALARAAPTARPRPLPHGWPELGSRPPRAVPRPRSCRPSPTATATPWSPRPDAAPTAALDAAAARATGAR